MHIEHVRKAETADEMRMELFRLRHYNPLVQAVMQMADCGGLSGEDRYVIMAYHALRELAHLQQNTLEVYATSGFSSIWPNMLDINISNRGNYDSTAKD